MTSTAHFHPELFRFLRDLARHNDKAWFAANKGRYEQHVKAPMLAFIRDFAEPFSLISPCYVADPSPVGGSMFRIYRDVRFSKEKTPYKTAATAQFRHKAGKDVYGPGFYLHLEPGNVFLGAGLWHPESAVLNRVRQAIVETPERWKKAAYGKAFSSAFELGGESLKRPPQGYPADGPYLDDLRRKDFVAMTPLSEKDACGPGFLSLVVKTYGRAAPFMQFLTTAVGLPW